MKLGTSPITGTIFCGKTKKKGKIEEWVGKKEDLTDNAISCVAEHMSYLLKQTDGDTQQNFTWKNFGRLSFLNKEGLEKENGKKEECCIWNLKDGIYSTSCGNEFHDNEYNENISSYTSFKYCPFCGKNVKIKHCDNSNERMLCNKPF